MLKIFLTGASGNVGQAVLQALQSSPDFEPSQLFLGLREPSNQAQARYFNFEQPASFLPALEGMQVLFLLRPPQLADVPRYFKPLIAAAQTAGLQHIVFLSVQGVEKSRYIPHHQIEALVRDSGIAYTFLRPAYFLENFTTTLRTELLENQRIFLPAGAAKFRLVGLSDVGSVAAAVLLHPAAHAQQAYDLTNEELWNFGQMAAIFTQVLGRKIDYVSPNLFRFYCYQRRKGLPSGLILVMILLHFLPRFQAAPPASDCIQRLCGRRPETLAEFIQAHRSFF